MRTRRGSERQARSHRGSIRLGALGRSEDAIAIYDDLIARFGDAAELPLRELVSITKDFLHKS
jgi:hypothetical protein